MKKQLFLAATAIIALASCSSDEFVGDNSPDKVNTNETAAITFGSSSKGLTRANYYGKDAAEKLNNKFIVGGFKGATGTSTVYTAGEITTKGIPATGMVFDNYVVTWSANSAATTESNSSDWDYVGTTALAPSSIAGHNQSIKYWDYSTDQYDFIAYSTSDATVVTGETAPASGQVHVTAINAAKAGDKDDVNAAYKLKGDIEGLKKCYIADMVTVYKDGTKGTKYQDVVNFTFRSLSSKVRVALYETVPGYAVKDVTFYTSASVKLNSESSDDKKATATLFTTGSSTKDNFYTDGEYKVYFPTIGKSNVEVSDYNKAHVVFTPSATGTTTTMNFGALDYQTARKHFEGGADSKWLARDAAHATFAGTADPYYQTALPNEEGAVLELRVDYTLYSEDGSGEQIKIYGATALVPAIYTAWKPNYAYTYLFKISDNTNGWTNKADAATNGTDPAGLYPITFDAIVLETEDNTQSTITNIATPSITTYQLGHKYGDGTDEEHGSKEYLASKGDIYIQVMGSDGVLKSDLNDKGKLYTVTGGGSTPATEAEILDALNIRTNTGDSPINGRNGWVLTTASVTNGFTTIPGADGNNITIAANTAAKFLPTANTTYAYVYDTGTYGGDYYPTKPEGWPTGYYTDPECTTAASGEWTAAGTYYTQSSTVRTYVTLSAKPDDWNTGTNDAYFTDEACTTAAASGDGYQDGNYYKKYTVNNKIYGVKVIKIAPAS